jgi:hypothetical protein
MGERAADLACTDERDLFPGHGLSLGFGMPWVLACHF